MKWQWAGHVAMQHPDRWDHKIFKWIPWKSKISVDRPQKYWLDDIRKINNKKVSNSSKPETLEKKGRNLHFA